MAERLGSAKKYLLSGVSYAIPFVACGGILIALAIALVPTTPSGPGFSGSLFLKVVLDIGTAAFSLLVPVLAGYIAFGIADWPGLVPEGRPSPALAPLLPERLRGRPRVEGPGSCPAARAGPGRVAVPSASRKLNALIL